MGSGRKWPWPNRCAVLEFGSREEGKPQKASVKIVGISTEIRTDRFRNTGCLKSLEPMEILIISLIFIYRLKLKVRRLKMALTLDKSVETSHFGDS
jgi:hypothetical protein